MSGLLGLFAPGGARPDEAVVQRMLARMSARGTLGAVRHTDAGTVGSVRHGSESAPDVSGPGPDGVVVAADASLFYLDDLRAALRRAGIDTAPTASPGRLLAAAYRAWGPHLAEHLEGDFAVLIHDAATGRVVCARDWVGKRPLFFARLRDTLLVASTPGALLAHPEVPADLDLASVAAAAAGLFASHTETAFTHVHALPPGHTLVWHDGGLRLLRHWQPPRVEARETLPGADLEEGARELRRLLTRAVAERLDPDGPTAVWMSGGWDSTTVFGAARAARAAAGDPRGPATGVVPVSIHYPAGDPGYEDQYIRSVAEHWGTTVRGIRIEQIPLLEAAEQRAAKRDEPFGHLYEEWNRSLARESREAGARVALDGVGGDQLFHLSYVYFSRLLARARAVRLAREWRRHGMRGAHSFLRWAVLPALPAGLRPLAPRLLGERGKSYLDRPVPAWMNPAFLARHGVLEREERNTPPRGAMTAAAYETHWYLTHPFGGKILSSVSSFALDEGVELRSPLLDQRVVEFATARPWSERIHGTETKRLLRRAAEAWLPRDVLAPRRVRTGLTSGYFRREFSQKYADFVRSVLHEPSLAQVGMVDADRLRRAVREYQRGGDENLGVCLFFTLQTELWFRGRAG